MKRLIILLILISSASAELCPIERQIQYSNGTYNIKYVGNMPMNELMIFDSINLTATKDLFQFNKTCPHMEYIMGRNQIKTYVRGNFTNFTCSYSIHWNKSLRFVGFAYYYKQGYGVLECDLLEQKYLIAPPKVTTTTKKPTTTITTTTLTTTTTTSTTTTTTQKTMNKTYAGKERLDMDGISFYVLSAVAIMLGLISGYGIVKLI